MQLEKPAACHTGPGAMLGSGTPPSHRATGGHGRVFSRRGTCSDFSLGTP